MGFGMSPSPTPPIENRLRYTFTDKRLIAEAFRHSSYVNEAPEAGLRDNERLEFLGDAVLNLVVGHILMERYGGLNEGDLSRMRSGLVNEQQLAQLARRLDLGALLKLGKGEAQTGGHEKSSILAGTLEALVAAVYMDGGFGAAFEIVKGLFLPLISQMERVNEHADFKSQLQELVQIRPGQMPGYSVVREEGPDHDKTFWVQLKVMEFETEGVGKSKKAAEQDAARKALAHLKTK
jgi:ribonuclease III